MAKPGVQEDAGILIKDPKTGNLVLSTRAKKKFIEDLKKFLLTGQLPPPMGTIFPCFKGKPVGDIAPDDLEDKAKYPQFHAVILGTYESVAIALNVQGQYPLLPLLFDPIALGGAINIPNLKIPDLVNPLKLPEITVKLATAGIPLPPPIPKPPIPALPVPFPPKIMLPLELPQLPALEAFLGGLSIGIPKLFADIAIKIPEIAMDAFIPPKIPPTLDVVCKIVKDALPKMLPLPDGDPVLLAAALPVLAEAIAECAIIAAVGSTLGSAPTQGSIVSTLGGKNIFDRSDGVAPAAADDITAKYEGKSILAVPGIERTTPEERRAYWDMCERVQLDKQTVETTADWFAALISQETGQTWDPHIVHRPPPGVKSTNATGLMQMIPTVAKEIGYTVEQLREMTIIEQLVPIEKFITQMLKPGWPITSLGVMYLKHFYGNEDTLKHANDPGYVLFGKDTAGAKQNTGGSAVTIGSVTASVNGQYYSGTKRGRIDINSGVIS